MGKAVQSNATRKAEKEARRLQRTIDALEKTCAAYEKRIVEYGKNEQRYTPVIEAVRVYRAFQLENREMGDVPIHRRALELKLHDTVFDAFVEAEAK